MFKNSFQPFENTHDSAKAHPLNAQKQSGKPKTSREFGRELQNENPECKMVSGPSKPQNLSTTQPPCKLIDSDTKKPDMFTTMTTFIVQPVVCPPRPQSKVSKDYSARLAEFKLMTSKAMPFPDQLDMKEAQFVTEYASTIFANMRSQEQGMQLQSDYLSKVQVPSEVKDTSRAFLVEWIIDVHRKFRLLPETLYVTVFLIDRFLSIQPIKKAQLHILGVTALLIATKYEEIYPPELKDLLQVSENKFQKAEVLRMELDMLQAVQFQVSTPSAYRFLERFKRLVGDSDDQAFFFAQYIQEIALLDASLLKYRNSEIAAASLILAARGLKKGLVWTAEVEAHTGMKSEDLAVVVEDVRSFVVEVNPKFLTTLKYKFSKSDYLEVASLPFKF